MYLRSHENKGQIQIDPDTRRYKVFLPPNPKNLIR